MTVKVATDGKHVRFCPTPNCENVVDMSPYYKETEIPCSKCSKSFCKMCSFPLHPGFNCEQVLKREFGDFVESKYVNKCPKCTTRVEKSAGCQHMTCGLCRYEWCWVCGMSYNSIVHYKEIGYTFCEMIGHGYFKSAKCSTIAVLLIMGVFMPFLIYFLCMHAIGFGFVKFLDWFKLTKYGQYLKARFDPIYEKHERS
jgi:hypothetical protein